MRKKTLVLGASLKPERASNQLLKMLSETDHEPIAIGRQPGKVGDIEIDDKLSTEEDIHTVSLYLNARAQNDYEDLILSLNPKRIIFNPGAENIELMQKARAAGIEAINACSLVMVRTGQY